MQIQYRYSSTVSAALTGLICGLTVTPREHDVCEAAAGLVDSVLGHELRVVVVRVGFERVGVDDLVAELGSDDERVAHDVPLTLGAEEAQQLAEIVDQARHLHPVRLAVPSDRLGRLEQVLDLADRGVRVGFVHEGVEHLHRLPNGHAGPDSLTEGLAHADVVLERLLGVLLLPVSGGDPCDTKPQVASGGPAHPGR